LFWKHYIPEFFARVMNYSKFIIDFSPDPQFNSAMTKKKFFISLFLISSCLISFAQVLNDYRSVASGNWNAIGTWESYNGTTWAAATVAPTATANIVSVQSTHTVTITANVSIDQVIVDVGGTLTSSGASPTTIANGTGVDLTINGTFIDNYAAATNVITWSANATWAYGAGGTLIKTTASSSNNWQSSYSGGASAMPSTANWIIRRNSAVAITLSTTTPASGSVYPNLTIENNVAGLWTTAAGSSFPTTATSAYPTIKGNLDIGGTGTSTVDFLNGQAYTGGNGTLVQGNVTVRTGSAIRNYGNGLEIQGDLTCSGTIYYSAGTGTRNIVFSGANAQSVSGAGTLNIYNMRINKTSGALTLNRAITVDNILTFTSGIINSTSTNLLTINTAGSVTGASNTSFVSGPVRYIGSSAFTFPVGKGSDYQALGISATTGGGTFWTEAFSNGCTAGCAATAYAGPNGSWTQTNSSTGSAPNNWFISCAENGNAAGVCGAGCGSDPSLHIGANPNSECVCLYCSQAQGDCGASYDACGPGDGFGFCAGGGVSTDKRIESPTINCTGKSSITLGFNYIENGQGTSDDATVWYYDGTSWAVLSNPAKVVICGGQGTWTAYSIALPASADNNPNVKIGFRWVNNNDGAGTDPSFAVDDITLSTTGATVDFTCEYFYTNPQTPYGNTLAASLNHISACEYWILTRNAGTASKNVTLTWDANSCPAIGVLSNLRVARYDGTSTWQDEGNAGTTGASAAGTITSAPVSNFSPFTLSSIAPIILPVELLNFNATYIDENNSVLVKWMTASEMNCASFAVERSLNGIDFTAIQVVPGAGNSSMQKNYSVVDYWPLSGTSYYRLKQTDYNGSYKHSNISVIEIEPAEFELLSFNSNEESGMLEVNLNCSNKCMITFELFDMAGNKVYASQQNVPGNNSRVLIPASSLSRGIYVLKTFNGKRIITRKVRW
jgi:hypothetical protein